MAIAALGDASIQAAVERQSLPQQSGRMGSAAPGSCRARVTFLFMAVQVLMLSMHGGERRAGTGVTAEAVLACPHMSPALLR